jgi:hypothetical protein
MRSLHILVHMTIHLLSGRAGHLFEPILLGAVVRGNTASGPARRHASRSPAGDDKLRAWFIAVRPQRERARTSYRRPAAPIYLGALDQAEDRVEQYR